MGVPVAVVSSQIDPFNGGRFTQWIASGEILESGTNLYTLAQARALADAEVARERDACAAVCESAELHSGDFLKNSDPRKTCAETIRARGQGGGNERS